MAAVSRMLGPQVLSFLFIQQSYSTVSVPTTVKFKIEGSISLFRVGHLKECWYRLNFMALKLLEGSAFVADFDLVPCESRERDLCILLNAGHIKHKQPVVSLFYQRC